MHGVSCRASGSTSTARTCTVGVGTGAGWARNTSVDGATEPGARHEPRGDADDEDDRNQYERTSPRLLVPFVVRADRVVEDLERQRGDRLTQTRRPELIAKSRKEQRR